MSKKRQNEEKRNIFFRRTKNSGTGPELQSKELNGKIENSSFD